eukprot:1144612-Pelagomonas_calceolata.AAC.4
MVNADNAALQFKFHTLSVLGIPHACRGPGAQPSNLSPARCLKVRRGKRQRGKKSFLPTLKSWMPTQSSLSVRQKENYIGCKDIA